MQRAQQFGAAGAIGITVLMLAIDISRAPLPVEETPAAAPPAKTVTSDPPPASAPTIKRARLRTTSSAHPQPAATARDVGEEGADIPVDAELPKPQMATDDVGLPPKDRLMVGDAHFDAGDLEAAWPYYLSVVEERPEDPLAAFALYKMAWFEWNTGKPDDAIVDLELARDWFQENDDRESSFFVAMIDKELAQLKAEHPSLQAPTPPE